MRVEDINNGGASAVNAVTSIGDFLKMGVDWGVKGAFLMTGIIGAVMLIRFLVVRSSES